MFSLYQDPAFAVSTRQLLSARHPLRYLFFELTRRCNLRCAHCGSSCPEYKDAGEIPADAFIKVVDRVSETFAPGQLMFCVTGGEPLLRKDWFEICSHIAEKGFSWGMTTNGMLLDERCVQRLAQAGMRTVAVSLDGSREAHEALRGVKGSYDAAIRGVRLLKESGSFSRVQVITVVSALNLRELPAMYERVASLGVDSWKLTSIEPMGDAIAQRSLFLKEEDYFRLFSFIRQARERAPFEVTYGCSHFLPEIYDDTVRDQGFLCGAGTMVASVASNGDILPCLDIDQRQLVRQGNVLRDDLIEVWENGFALFRRNKADESSLCRDCRYSQVCRGDSWHSWDFQTGRPRICFEKHIFYQFVQDKKGKREKHEHPSL